MRQSHPFSLLGAAFLLVTLATALPDGDSDMNMDGDMDMGHKDAMSTPAEDWAQSYFALGQHSGSILAHIILEVISWCFILPIGKFITANEVKQLFPWFTFFVH
jgi:hypothetical protein